MPSSQTTEDFGSGFKLRPPKSETSLAQTNTYCHRLSSGQKLLITWQKRVWRSNLCGRYHKILSSKVSVKYWQNKWGIRISNYVVSLLLIVSFLRSSHPLRLRHVQGTCWVSHAGHPGAPSVFAGAWWGRSHWSSKNYLPTKPVP